MEKILRQRRKSSTNLINKNFKHFIADLKSTESRFREKELKKKEIMERSVSSNFRRKSSLGDVLKKDNFMFKTSVISPSYKFNKMKEIQKIKHNMNNLRKINKVRPSSGKFANKASSKIYKEMKLNFAYKTTNYLKKNSNSSFEASLGEKLKNSSTPKLKITNFIKNNFAPKNIGIGVKKGRSASQSHFMAKRSQILGEKKSSVGDILKEYKNNFRKLNQNRKHSLGRVKFNFKESFENFQKSHNFDLGKLKKVEKLDKKYDTFRRNMKKLDRKNDESKAKILKNFDQYLKKADKTPKKDLCSSKKSTITEECVSKKANRSNSKKTLSMKQMSLLQKSKSVYTLKKPKNEERGMSFTERLKQSNIKLKKKKLKENLEKIEFEGESKELGSLASLEVPKLSTHEAEIVMERTKKLKKIKKSNPNFDFFSEKKESIIPLYTLDRFIEFLRSNTEFDFSEK